MNSLMVLGIIICFLMHGNVNIVRKEKKVKFKSLSYCMFYITKTVIIIIIIIIIILAILLFSAES
jgi:hypothetical protein